MTEKKLNGTVIVTYRCHARCTMCNRYKAPSRPEEELSIETIKKLPKMYFTNITGGEPFIRQDLKDIVRELYKKADRIVISTNGVFTDRIIDRETSRVICSPIDRPPRGPRPKITLPQLLACACFSCSAAASAAAFSAPRFAKISCAECESTASSYLP